MSQGRGGGKDGSLNRRGHAKAAPMKTKEEVEAETNELNMNARNVLEAYKKISHLWQSKNVPLQHRVTFIEAIKVLDMKMMA